MSPRVFAMMGTQENLALITERKNPSTSPYYS